MALAPHQQRVVDEKTELDDKIVKLRAFMSNNKIYGELEQVDRLLLQAQANAMERYSELLGKRIARF